MNKEATNGLTSGPQTTPPNNLEMLLDIQLPLTLRFGKTEMPLGEIAALGLQSSIELDRAVDDPIEILVNGRLIARGEPVVVQGNYGVRILEITSRKDRLEMSSLSSDEGQGAQD
ncbi:MAG TPA: flagellar motor switch protein FliN [Edaphobacter sp.]|nr:flagellar motor switch protein FliN [Edaphobacter sp.]